MGNVHEKFGEDPVAPPGERGEAPPMGGRPKIM